MSTVLRFQITLRQCYPMKRGKDLVNSFHDLENG